MQDYVDIVGEECIEIEHSTYDLVNLALEDGLTTSHGFDLNMDSANVEASTCCAVISFSISCSNALPFHHKQSLKF